MQEVGGSSPPLGPIPFASSRYESLLRLPSAAELQPGSPPISSSSSAVLSRIKAESPRLSTLSRIRGSVFDVRRLKRHASNSRLTPSVRSSLRALGR